jgi:GNAT superfamily N-acetyltransferase
VDEDARPGAGPPADLSIRRLVPDEWQLLRQVRLAALEESPAAFASGFEREAAFGETRWRFRLQTSAHFVAEREGELVGMARAVRHFDPDSDLRPEMELVSMWVARAHRRGGVGARLLAEVLNYARAEGEPLLGLWVAGGNENAEAFYRAAGFVRTGEEQDMPHRPAECEVRMVIQL